MFPWLDLAELLKKIAEKIRAGRFIGKAASFNASGDIVDQETYEVEDTRIIKRGVLCFQIHVIQTWTIVTVTAQPAGKVKVGPFPELVKESVISEQQVTCPPELDEESIHHATTAMMLFGRPHPAHNLLPTSETRQPARPGA